METRRSSCPHLKTCKWSEEDSDTFLELIKVICFVLLFLFFLFSGCKKGHLLSMPQFRLQAPLHVLYGKRAAWKMVIIVILA